MWLLFLKTNLSKLKSLLKWQSIIYTNTCTCYHNHGRSHYQRTSQEDAELNSGLQAIGGKGTTLTANKGDNDIKNKPKQSHTTTVENGNYGKYTFVEQWTKN